MLFQIFNQFFLFLDKFLLDFNLFEITGKKFITFSKFFLLKSIFISEPLFLKKKYNRNIEKKANHQKVPFSSI